MSRRLREFVVTRGRARDESDLPLETPITRTGNNAPRVLNPDEDALVSQCASPQTVVDLSAGSQLAIGVVRVLVLDLVDIGVLSLGQQAVAEVAPHQDINLLTEVLDGIANL